MSITAYVFGKLYIKKTNTFSIKNVLSRTRRGWGAPVCVRTNSISSQSRCHSGRNEAQTVTKLSKSIIHRALINYIQSQNHILISYDC